MEEEEGGRRRGRRGEAEERRRRGAFGPEVDAKTRSSCIKHQKLNWKKKSGPVYKWIYRECVTDDPRRCVIVYSA